MWVDGQGIMSLFTATVAAVIFMGVSIFQVKDAPEFYEDPLQKSAPTSESVGPMPAKTKTYADMACWTPNIDPEDSISDATFSKQPERKAQTCWTNDSHPKERRHKRVSPQRRECKVESCWIPNENASEQAPTKQMVRKSRKISTTNPAPFHRAAREIVQSLKNRDPMVVDPDVSLIADQVDSDPNAKWILGLCFHFGFGIRQSPQNAESLYKSAAFEGLSIATDLISVTLEFQQSLEDEHNADYFSAVIMALEASGQGYIRSCLAKYARGGNLVAKYALAMSYPPGDMRNSHLERLRTRLDSNLNRIIRVQTERYIDLGALSKKIDQEDLEAMFQLALHFKAEHNEPASLIWLKKAAGKGHEGAIQELALSGQVNSKSCIWEEVPVDANPGLQQRG